MFGKNLIFFQSLCLLSLLLGGSFACTRTTTRLEAPTAPVASPTSTPSYVENGDQPQGPRSSSGPDIPFDGSQPEKLNAPKLPTTESASPGSRRTDIYAELWGQNLVCEETAP